VQTLRALALERRPVEQRPVNVHVLEKQVDQRVGQIVRRIRRG
jgi:hypothetical protein